MWIPWIFSGNPRWLPWWTVWVSSCRGAQPSMPRRHPQPCWRHRRHPSRPPPRRWGDPTKKNWMLDGFHLEKHWFLVIFGWFHLKIHGFLENLAGFHLKREFDGMVLVEFTWNFKWSSWWFLWISAEQSSFLGETSQEQMMFSSTITSRMWGFELQDMGFTWFLKMLWDERKIWRGPTLFFPPCRSQQQQQQQQQQQLGFHHQPKKTYGIDRYKWGYPSQHPAISLGFSMK